MANHQLKDNTGKRFGNMIVLKDSGLRQNRKVVWTCQCDCGEITEIDTAHWGKTASCGHIKGVKSKDISGQRFGKLIAIRRDGKYEKNGVSYWLCQCDCGRQIRTILTGLTSGSTQSCGLCTRSKGELKIEEILKENNIIFETQKTFSTCRFPNTNLPGRYDFYLPNYNLLIEYDGEQHFSYKEKNTFWNTKEEFEKCHYRDIYKTQWAQKNNIRLKRIPYWDYDKIDLNYILN